MNPFYFFCFGFFWVALSFLCFQSTGWGKISIYYKYNGQSILQKKYFQFSRFRWLMPYTYYLTIGASTEGLYLASWVPFFFCYPPLFIPWTDISVGRKKMMLFGTFGLQMLEFKFEKVPLVSFTTFAGLEDFLKQAAGNNLKFV